MRAVCGPGGFTTSGGLSTFTALLDGTVKNLDYGDKDVVLARATITGTAQGAATSLVYEFIDLYDDATTMSGSRLA